jgi:high-affinity Fe2+/Pb2+ permease
MNNSTKTVLTDMAAITTIGIVTIITGIISAKYGLILGVLFLTTAAIMLAVIFSQIRMKATLKRCIKDMESTNKEIKDIYRRM